MPHRPTCGALPLLALAGAALLAAGPALAGTPASPSTAVGIQGQCPRAADPPAAQPADASTASAAPSAADIAADSTPLFSVSPAPSCSDPLCYWAQSTTYSNTRSHVHMVMVDPEMVDTSRGISHITADCGVADGPDIGDSQWVFTGHVHADRADGQLRADTATVQIVDHHIASITALGNPALFQRLPTNPLGTDGGAAPPAPAVPAAAPAAPTAPGTPAPKAGLANVTIHGHAQSITYDATHDQIRFMGNSWFTDGCNDIISELVTYDMGNQTVQAGEAPGSQGRVHGTIRNTHAGSETGCTADTGAEAAGGSQGSTRRRPVRPGSAKSGTP